MNVIRYWEKEMKYAMKIVVLEGSPNRNGSTHILADCFRQGAEEAGHTVELIDVAHADIHPCTGCIHCGYEGPCVQKDDVEGIRRKILDADMLVFATPLYYYGMSAQLKTMVDRFCWLWPGTATTGPLGPWRPTTRLWCST